MAPLPQPQNLSGRSSAWILIGMPSAGKTTIGRPLADRLGVTFRDTDDIIRERMGCQLQDIIHREGLPGFIQIEAACVKTLGEARQVIATGGSVIYEEATMAHLARLGRIVYLYWPPRTLAERVGDLDRRGVVHEPRQNLDDLFEERHPLYINHAHQVVDCSHKSVDQIISAIQTWQDADHPLTALVLDTLYQMQIGRPPTTTDLSREMARQFHLKTRQARAAINALAQAGQLEYRDHCGHIVVGESMQRPVAVAPGLYLKPQGHSFQGAPGDIVITLSEGAAFGSGRHPTTRLAIQALQTVLPVLKRTYPDQALTGLDIGTGNGVLALAAVRLGLDHCLGVDTDANARFEARLNATLNHLDRHISIPDQTPLDVTLRYHLIVANLRCPTLIALADTIQQQLCPKGYLIVSGLKREDRQALAACYGNLGFTLDSEDIQGQWMAMAWINS